MYLEPGRQVGDGEQAQGLLVGARGVHVERGRLHLDCEHAHLLPGDGCLVIVVIERVAGEDVANFKLHALIATGCDGALEQVEAGDGGVGAGQLVLVGVVGIGAGAHAGHYVADLDLVRDTAGGAHADDGLDAVEVEQLVGVDADGGHAHAAAHDGDGDALVGTGVAQHVANGVEAADVF